MNMQNRTDAKNIQTFSKIKTMDIANLDIANLDIANLYEEDTEIPGRVFVTSAYGNLKPRLEYIVDGVKMFVSIEDNPMLLNPESMEETIVAYFKGIGDWIKINKENLLEFWYNPEMSLSKFAKNLKTVNGNNIWLNREAKKEG